MRKKEAETPVRRSARLQPVETSEEMLTNVEVEEQDAPISLLRGSIKAHRLLPDTAEFQPGTEPTQPVSKEAQTPAPARTMKNSLHEFLEGKVQAVHGEGPEHFPCVVLKRLEVPEKEQEKEKKKEVVEKRQVIVQPTPAYSSNLRMREKMPAPGSDWNLLRERRTLKPLDTAIPRKRTMGDRRKRALCTSLCIYLLPWLLILGGVSWYLWAFGTPRSLLAVPVQMQQSWNSFAVLWRKWQQKEPCSSHCRFLLVESIPEDLQYKQEALHHSSIYQAWMELLEGAKNSVDIAAFYFTLRDTDLEIEAPSSRQGKNVLEKLLDLPSKGVKLNIAVNSPQSSNNNTEDLAKKGADVKYLDFKHLTGGVLHTKLWIVDKQHVYVGSANMDWRSLTQVKELGVVLYNCSCLARDLHKVFHMYRYLGEDGASIPQVWPAAFSADSSHTRPLHVLLNNSTAEVYISSSPFVLCSEDRTSDLAAILSVIDDAEQFIYISVMDYVPRCQFCNPKRFWPAIDDQLRAAACDRGVEVRLLVSCWSHSDMSMFIFLESLSLLSREPLGCSIQVKVFVIPANEEQKKIPFARVNHNKYMVTDRIAYIGTSNWSEDYFTNTAGVGLIINQTATDVGDGTLVRQELEAVFLRDWDSSYTHSLHNKLSCNTEA